MLNMLLNLINFRSGLIRSLVSHGYEVVAVAPADKYVPPIADIGCKFIPLSIDDNATHPRDLDAALALDSYYYGLFSVPVFLID